MTQHIGLSLRDLQKATKKAIDRKCTLCNKKDCLIKLDDEIQYYSRLKGFESYFCKSCCQIVNFLLLK